MLLLTSPYFRPRLGGLKARRSIELDGVSDWVEDYTDEVYQIAYEKLNLENGKEAEEASYL